MRTKLLLILSCLLCTLFVASAQERIEKRYSVFFRVGKADIDRTYLENDHVIQTMISDIQATLENDGYTPDSLLIYASASPEGSYALNERLARIRANATKDFIIQALPQLKNTSIKIESRPNDWSGLIQSLRSNESTPYREEILKVLTNQHISDKETTLRKMPEAYAFIRDNMLHKMRSATVTIRVIGKVDEFAVEHEPVITIDSLITFPAEGGLRALPFKATPADGTLPTVTYDADWIESITPATDSIRIVAKANTLPQKRIAPISIQYLGKTIEVNVAQDAATPIVEEAPETIETTEPIEETTSEKKPFYIGIKTNMLYDLALVPNIGVEFALGKRVSVVGNWMYSWWKSDKVNWYWRTYGGDLAVRYWFGKAAKEKPLQGHHLGLYGQIITYDFELGGRGYLGDRWTYGGGLEYGYSLPVAKRFNIDFNLGVGYLGGEYKEYLPIDGHYVWQATKRRQYIGPTKLEISLVWLIGRGNMNIEKGGKR